MVMKRHLWLNLSEIKDREKTFHLDVLISPSGRFGTSVETVVENLREAKSQSAAFRIYIPCQSNSPPSTSNPPDPSKDNWRQGQKANMVTCAPPPWSRGQRRCNARRRHNLRKGDRQKVVRKTTGPLKKKTDHPQPKGAKAQ